MNIEFIAGFAVITPDPARSRGLYVDALGLPLEASEGSDYFHSERVDGARHFGVWPLAEAAQACFGNPEWPQDVTVPQASVEFEVADPGAVAAPPQSFAAPASSWCTTPARSRGVRPSPGCFPRRG